MAFKVPQMVDWWCDDTNKKCILQLQFWPFQLHTVFNLALSVTRSKKCIVTRIHAVLYLFDISFLLEFTKEKLLGRKTVRQITNLKLRFWSYDTFYWCRWIDSKTDSAGYKNKAEILSYGFICHKLFDIFIQRFREHNQAIR